MKCRQCREIYPEDQLVILADHFVCASCKPVFLQRLSEGSFESLAPIILASRGRRLATALLDLLIGAAFLLPGFILAMVSMSNVFNNFVDGGDHFSPNGLSRALSGAKAGGATLVVGFFVFIVWNIICLHKNGQTIGKMIMGIKVVYRDNTSIGFWGIFLKRYLPVTGVVFVPFAGPLIYLVMFLIDSLLIFRVKQSCLHDQMAGTKVIMSK